MRAPLLLSLSLVGSLVMACGKPLTTPTVRRVTLVDGRKIFGTLPTGPEDRPALAGLPTIATYRWGLPGAHFTGVSPAEDSASQTFAAHEQRLFASEVLRVNGWREASAGETAEFELAVLRIERGAEWQETRADPRGQMPNPNPCRNRPAAQRSLCVEPLPRDYPPITVTMRGTDVRFAFAIVRLADRATAWWIAPLPSQIQIATLRLLQAGAESPPALGR